MKKSVFLLLLVLICVPTFAQKEIKVTSLSLSSGEGPLSNGIFFEGNFARGNDIINISLGERDMYLLYLKGIGKKFSVGPSFEYFHNVPLLGIMANSTPLTAGKLSIGTMTWTGVSAGNPDEKIQLLNWRFLFFWQSIDLNYKNLTATGAIMYFNDWGPLIDIKYRQPINKKFTLFTSAGYSFYRDGKALLKLGITYTP
jgi:hypothetical protein